MLENDTARHLLRAYHDSTLDDDGVPQPLMMLHGMREEITIRPHIELPSAYHMAHYIHDFVNDRTTAITVCGRFFKQIGKELFQGTILYHVDRIGSHMIRGIDANTNRFHVLDDSEYWRAFPYDFDQGPLDPQEPIGFHPGPENISIEELLEDEEDDDEDDDDEVIR